MATGVDRRTFLTIGAAALASEGCGLTSRGTLDSLVRSNPVKSKYRTIGHQILDVERVVGSKPEDYKVLDDIIDASKSKIKPQAFHDYWNVVDTLYNISQVLKTKGFKYKVNDLHHMGLRTRRLDCDNLSMIYLSVAEALKLPLVAVNAPEHVFVRWVRQGGSYINWEPTSSGVNSDAHYKKIFNISDRAIKKGTFMKSLTKSEALANAYFLVGCALREKRKQNLALKYINGALRRDPLLEAAYVERASLKLEKGNLDGSIKDLDTAIDLAPNDADAHYNRGQRYCKKREFHKAVRDFTSSIKLKPTANGFMARGYANYKLGQIKEAREDFKVAQSYDSSYKLEIGLWKYFITNQEAFFPF